MLLELALPFAMSLALEVSVNTGEPSECLRSPQLTAFHVELLRTENAVWFTQGERNEMSADPLLKRLSQGVIDIHPDPEYQGSELSVEAVRGSLNRLGPGRDAENLQLDARSDFYIHSGILVLADYTGIRWYWCSWDNLYLSDVLDRDGGLRWYSLR
jgi:hypothetical protein